jgi:hypothetical protein
VTHFLRRAWFSAVLLTIAVSARAGVSYDESPAFTFDTRDYLGGLAAESTVFAFDTRLVDGLQGAAVSATFAFDTRGTTLPPLQITGVLRDSAGVPVVGATIQIKRAGAIFWQGVSGAGGTFTTPNLSGVNYTVIVSKAGYVTNISTQSGAVGGNLTLNITLQPLAAAPNATTVSRTLTGNEVRPAPTSSDPDAPVLLRYNGSQLVTDMSGLNTGRMTVVISHGWVPLDFGDFPAALDWARNLAFLIYNHHPGLAQPPNILVWDWRQKAYTHLPETQTASEVGLELGKALHGVLGPGYSQHVHFVGHSLGAILNRYACDYAHRSLTGNHSRDNPLTGWNSALTKPHITLLDEAELATVADTRVLVSAAVGAAYANLQGLILAAALEAKKDWKYPIPRDAWWVDNYISCIGLQHSDAVNICLPAMVLASNDPVTAFINGHSYAHLWYRNSVYPAGAGAAPPPVGFGSSLENAGAFPPGGYGLTNGSLWLENLGTPDILDLTLDPNPLWNQATLTLAAAFAVPTAASLVQPLDALGQGVLNGYESSILWAGDIGGTAIVKTGQVITQTKEKVGLWWDAAMDKASNILDSINPDALLAGAMSKGVFGLLLQTQQFAPAPNGLASGTTFLAAAAPDPAQPPYAWVTVTVPPNAGLMAFDFTVTGDPVDDRIACAVNGRSVFTLAAKFAPEGEPMSTDLIDVSAYAGQAIEVFFGLAGGTSTNCQVEIDGLRFVTVPTPKVAVGVAAGTASVKWPAAASGWTLESSETLALGSWQTVPTGTGLTLDSGVATLQEAVSLPKKFYRLRRNP